MISATARSLLAAFIAICAGAARADDVADFYRGKTVNIVVGYSPGGGYDQVSRILIRHMPKYIPGNPHMVVQNMPGAGTVVAANFVTNTSPRDGSVIGMYGDMMLVAPLLKLQGVQFDPRQFGWLGSFASRPTPVIFVRSDSPATTLDDAKLKEDLIGAEGAGFKILLDSLNPERILIGAEVVGMGFRALEKATQYAKDRIVFDRPIGMNQSIQHPLAESWAELSAANLMVWRAAALYDAGKPCGAEANAAKYLGADAAFLAADRAVRTHGGYGYAREYNVERYFRELVPQRMAPVSRELILCYLAERVLGLPKSY